MVVEMYVLSNVSYIGRELVDSLGDASGLSLKSALDIKKYSEELSELLEKIKEVVGLSGDCTIDIDMAAFDAAISKVCRKKRARFVFDSSYKRLDTPTDPENFSWISSRHCIPIWKVHARKSCPRS